MINPTSVEWIKFQHESTNHKYDDYLPYEYHLRQVVKFARLFIDLIPKENQESVIYGAWGHDLLEDTRVSYNDIRKVVGLEAADLIYALTNEKGKSRSERANDKYYEGIRNTPFAVYVKLCDRLANVEYSYLTSSRMFEMYKKENEEFGKQLGVYLVPGYTEHPYFPLFAQLLEMFNNSK
jgi:(p)ppGpp synthase/HD superfamily hydrolase